MAGEQLRLQPFGDDQYKVLVIGRADDKLSVFVNTGRKLLQAYSAVAITTLTSLGYQGDQKHLMEDISVAWYAQVSGHSETPRTVLWNDDPKEVALEKLRDVICFQRWGKTVNQYPKVQDVFSKLNFGVVAEDPIGFARGAAIRALIAASYDRETVPLVYFDEMRRYPIHAGELLKLIEAFKIEGEDIERFDLTFGCFMMDRFNAAVEVLNGDSRPLKDNLTWQKYIDDWDDYRYWLDKRQGSLDSPQP